MCVLAWGNISVVVTHSMPLTACDQCCPGIDPSTLHLRQVFGQVVELLALFLLVAGHDIGEDLGELVAKAAAAPDAPARQA